MSEKKQIKEYVYIDSLEVNSILAQFEDGIPSVIEEIRQSTETNTEGTTGKVSSDVTGGVDAGLKGEAKIGSEFGTTNNESNSEMYQEAISTVYHDYAINIMTNKLDGAKLLKTTTKQPEGAYVQLTSNFELIDPVSIGSNLDSDTVSFMLNLDSNNSPDVEDAQKGFEAMIKLSTILNKFFPDSLLITTNNALTIAEKSNFRMNEAQLKSLVLAKRKIKVIGKIESIVTNDILDEDQLTKNVEENPTLLMSLMPKFSFSILHVFGLIKKEDRLIKPIAIYFE